MLIHQPGRRVLITVAEPALNRDDRIIKHGRAFQVYGAQFFLRVRTMR
jgi:hypothetical protein